MPRIRRHGSSQDTDLLRKIQPCHHNASTCRLFCYLEKKAIHEAAVPKLGNRTGQDKPLPSSMRQRQDGQRYPQQGRQRPAPYFNIDPDAAMADLDQPTDTARFAEIAEGCTRGRADLASRGLNEEGAKSLRLFSTWEITRYLIPVAQAHFRRVLKANPELPQGRSETEGGAKWFTLDEVLRLRAFFAAQGSKAKNYLPYRPEGLLKQNSSPWPTSRAASVRPRPQRIWRCRRHWTATRCWWWIWTARAP